MLMLTKAYVLDVIISLSLSSYFLKPFPHAFFFSHMYSPQIIHLGGVDFQASTYTRLLNINLLNRRSIDLPFFLSFQGSGLACQHFIYWPIILRVFTYQTLGIKAKKI